MKNERKCCHIISDVTALFDVIEMITFPSCYLVILYDFARFYFVTDFLPDSSMKSITSAQIQTVFQNTAGEDVGNGTEDDIFCGENAVESEEISCVGHKSIEVVKSDAE